MLRDRVMVATDGDEALFVETGVKKSQAMMMMITSRTYGGFKYRVLRSHFT